MRHQIYWTSYYSSIGWKFWNRASDENASALELVDITKEVTDCSAYGICRHYESVGIMVSDVMLKAAKERGLRIKVKAKSGDEAVLTVAAEQISAQLEAIASKTPAGKVASDASTLKPSTKQASGGGKKKSKH